MLPPLIKFQIRTGLLAISLLFAFTAIAQQSLRHRNINFYHLTTAQGLSDNYIADMCLDKTGNLWIATWDGLNMFNGKTVTQFLKREYPQLQSDYLNQVICDNENRIWVMGQGGVVTLIDENRRFHNISAYQNGRQAGIKRMLKTKEYGVILFTKEGFFSLPHEKDILNKDSLIIDEFTEIHVNGFDSLLKRTFSQTELYDENNYIFSTANRFYKINFKEKRVEREWQLPDLQIYIQWQPGELLVSHKQKPELQSVNLVTGQISWPLRGIKDQFGNPFSGKINTAKMLNTELLLLAVQNAGLYLFNTKTKLLVNYSHNAADPSTIVNDWPSVITTGTNGWVFIGALPNGISYFKYNAVIGQKTIFLDNKGNSYDGLVGRMATRDNNIFYLGTGKALLKWNRSTNTTTFVDYAIPNGESLLNKEYMNCLAFDKSGRLWFNTGSHGIFVMDRNDKVVHHFYYDTTRSNSLVALTATDIVPGQDGYIWVSMRRGLCRINSNNFKVDKLMKTRLSELSGYYCTKIFFSDDDHLWIATRGKGLFRYTLSTDSLVVFNEENGFINNNVISINKDNYNNIYAGTDKGMQVFLQNGQTKLVTQQDGLMHPYVEILLLDKKNRMWIGNDVGIACFNIEDTSLKYFDETYGLSIQGFRRGSYCHTSDDEMFWGTERGMQYFYPDELYNYETELKVNVNRIETRKIVSNLTGSNSFKLSASDNYVTFYFSTIEYLAQLRVFYEYKLDGLDENWIKVVNQNFVRYSALSPGTYTFKVRASNDNKVWYNAENEITILIAIPFYGTWWFKILGLVLASGLIWYVISHYQKKQQKQKEDLETALVINYFASQINSRYKADELLWDVAKNLIGKLGFEECMIYLWNDDKTELIQKAGYGAKGSMEAIINRAEYNIPKGKGIVGAAVESKQNLLVNDTSKDKRYFTVDNKITLSELCVPLIHDNEVLGAINIEQHQKNFFAPKHLKMLSTIAVLCANQLQRIRAEEEKQQARIEALQNKQKAVETRLQTLRLQMNPHFLFNALNSIQQMILANEEIIATRYLSRFSKLLRSILVHSDKEYVSLKEELEILTLYIELESIRFKDSFNYTIECDDEIDTDEIKLPTLLIQPFVENAIWHGLMHKEGERLLTVKFSEKDECIKCVVEDNGIGRERSLEVKLAAGHGNKHTSKGIAVSIERLNAMGNGNGHGSMQIVDLKDEKGNAKGTRVEIIFPIQNN